MWSHFCHQHMRSANWIDNNGLKHDFLEQYIQHFFSLQFPLARSLLWLNNDRLDRLHVAKRGIKNHSKYQQ